MAECCKGLAPESECACAKSRIAEVEAALGSLVTVYYQDMRGAGRSIKDVDATLAPMRRILAPTNQQ